MHVHAFRNPSTISEMRSVEMFDDDVTVTVKGASRAKVRAKSLPTSWSDMCKEENSSWKDARKTQQRALTERRRARSLKRAMLDGLNEVGIG